MYFELIRRVIENEVEAYADDNSQTSEQLLSSIGGHLQDMAAQYRTDEPTINYQDSLSRLGYLYRHAAAHAFLFEKALSESPSLSKHIADAHNSTLSICSMGGGPGTELLGVTKHLSRAHSAMPKRITFSVIDNVPEWSETWDYLATQTEAVLASSLSKYDVEPPVIAPMFIPLDVLDPDSYRNYTHKFRHADLVIFNYLFSENKSRLSDAHDAIQRLAELTPQGCSYVAIDRFEDDPQFQVTVADIFQSVFETEVQVHTYNGTIDYDEDKEVLGPILLQALGQPRMKFFTPAREPTAFWFVTTDEAP